VDIGRLVDAHHFLRCRYSSHPNPHTRSCAYPHWLWTGFILALLFLPGKDRFLGLSAWSLLESSLSRPSRAPDWLVRSFTFGPLKPIPRPPPRSDGGGSGCGFQESWVSTLWPWLGLGL